MTRFCPARGGPQLSLLQPTINREFSSFNCNLSLNHLWVFSSIHSEQHSSCHVLIKEWYLSANCNTMSSILRLFTRARRRGTAWNCRLEHSHAQSFLSEIFSFLVQENSYDGFPVGFLNRRWCVPKDEDFLITIPQYPSSNNMDKFRLFLHVIVTSSNPWKLLLCQPNSRVLKFSYTFSNVMDIT